jgi:predicted HD phosphohydrolase
MQVTAVPSLLDLFSSKGAMQYGEDVTQLQHALQCGALAQAEGACDALVLAAVLHDVGHRCIVTPPQQLSKATMIGTKCWAQSGCLGGSVPT